MRAISKSVVFIGTPCMSCLSCIAEFTYCILFRTQKENSGDLDDIEKVLESINNTSSTDAASASTSSAATNSSSNKSVLTIEHRYLKNCLCS